MARYLGQKLLSPAMSKPSVLSPEQAQKHREPVQEWARCHQHDRVQESFNRTELKRHRANKGYPLVVGVVGTHLLRSVFRHLLTNCTHGCLEILYEQTH